MANGKLVIGIIVAGIAALLWSRSREPKYTVPTFITIWDEYCTSNYAVQFIDTRHSILGWEYLQSPENIWVSERTINGWEAHAQSCAIA